MRLTRPGRADGMSDAKQPIGGVLPLTLPQPCPVCGAKVVLTHVTEWGADDGLIVGIEYDCETEPDIDSREWRQWFSGHYRMPYVDWLPWETGMLEWLNSHYFVQTED